MHAPNGSASYENFSVKITLENKNELGFEQVSPIVDPMFKILRNHRTREATMKCHKKVSAFPLTMGLESPNVPGVPHV